MDFVNNYFYIFIAIIIIILFIIIIKIAFSPFNNISDDQANMIYDLIQHITCILNSNNVNYIMTGGTLLGSVRNKGLIPWDDDADLIVFNTTVDNLLNILQSLVNYDIIIYETRRGNMVKVKCKSLDVCVDLFLVHKDNNNIYRFMYPYDRLYPNEFFHESEIFPIKYYKFGPLDLKGPNNPIDYLNRTYPNWYHIAHKWNGASYLTKTNDIKKDELLPKLPNTWFKLFNCPF